MKIKQIRIDRKYDKTGYDAAITLVGGSSYPADINIQIPEDMLVPIVAIIQQATVVAMSNAAQQFKEEVAASLAPPVETAAIENKVGDAPNPILDDKPF
jgi:hypothetical protein